MSFLTPIAALIAAGITVPLLVGMYFLKLRRRVLPISSTLLWRRALQDMRVNTPFQKLRRNLLLFLQLLLLAALLFALARPLAKAAGKSGERLVILIDQSASMNATDIKATRLDEAKRWALDLIEGREFTGGGGTMVVTFARDARVVQPFTSDKALLRMAIRGIEATDHISDLGPALRMVEPYVADARPNGASGGAIGPSETDVGVYVVSDGQVVRDPPLSLRGGTLNYVRIGDLPATPIDNLAITLLAARRDPLHPSRTVVHVRLANYGAAPVRAHVTLTVNGRTQNVTPVEAPAYHAPEHPAAGGRALSANTGGGGGTAAVYGAPGIVELSFSLELPGGAVITVAHDHEDQLAADNQASLVLAPPLQVQVLLVTSGNGFLERAIRAAGVRKLVVETPADYENHDPRFLRRGADNSRGSGDSGGGDSGGEGYDVLVFDGYSPRTVPLVAGLYLGAAPPLEGLALVSPGPGEPRMQEVLNWAREHPVMRYVKLDDVWLQDPGRLFLPDKAAILATGQGGPVMADLTEAGVRHVVTSFTVLNTNWPMQTSFIPFIMNALRTLAYGGETETLSYKYRPGDAVLVPAAALATTLSYGGPVPMEARVEGGRAVLPMFAHVGLYHCSRGVLPPWQEIAVNLCDELESDLHAPQHLEVHAAAQMTITPTVTARQEVWRWFVWAALGLLLVEWFVYARRIHV